MESCKVINGYEEQFTQAYMEYAISIPIFISLQIALLMYSVHVEYFNRNDPRFRKISISLRALYVLLQLIGLWWTVWDLFRIVIDPYTLILRGNISCNIAAFTPKMVPGPFYLVYLYQLLLRLESSFKKSYLKLSKCTLYTLKLMVIVPIVASHSYFTVLAVNTDGYSLCIEDWTPMDMPSEQVSFCRLPISPRAILVVTCMSIWIPIMNIVIAVIFGIKLNRVLSDSQTKGNIKLKLKFKSLIIKNYILTIVGSISTVLFYLLWIFVGHGLFLYADLFINCLVIGLMFKHNSRHYFRLCKCCILLCFLHPNENERRMAELALEMESTTGNTSRLGTPRPDLSRRVSPSAVSTPEIPAITLDSAEEIVSRDTFNVNQLELENIDLDVVQNIFNEENMVQSTTKTPEIVITPPCNDDKPVQEMVSNTEDK